MHAEHVEVSLVGRPKYLDRRQAQSTVSESYPKSFRRAGGRERLELKARLSADGSRKSLGYVSRSTVAVATGYKRWGLTFNEHDVAI